MSKKIAIFITALAILVSAYSAHAQQKAPLLGFLSSGNEPFFASRYAAFRDKMRGLGYVEGRTIRYAYRYGEGKNHRLAGLATELVRLEPKVIVTIGTPASMLPFPLPHQLRAPWQIHPMSPADPLPEMRPLP